MKVKIDERTIGEAVRRNSHRCMIADAIQKAEPKAIHISVDLQKIEFSLKKDGTRFTFLTPRKAQESLIKFDQGKKVEPFEFSILPIRMKAMGWRAAHPKTKRGKYKKTGKKRYVPTAKREFGLRKYEETK